MRNSLLLLGAALAAACTGSRKEAEQASDVSAAPGATSVAEAAAAPRGQLVYV
jgi:cytochrome c5